jgi:carboxypeptidase Taq
MQEYLGITPRNDSEGVLQDVHWSSGSVGYFSTYALGNLISAQIWATARTEIPDLENHIRHGRFGELRHWLGEKIHQHGRKYDPQDLVERVTGSRITLEPYLQYLTDKYTEIYKL